MASQTRTSAWSGGACARSGPRKRRAAPPQLEIAKQIPPFALNPTAMGGICLASLPLGPLKRGWPARVGSPNAERVPFSSCWNEETSECGGSGGRTTGARSAQRSSVHACFGGGWWVPWPPPRARDALSARYWGTRHHEVEKRGARWCSGEHMATGFVGANFCQGGAKERLGVVFRPTVCLLAERGLFGA